MHEGFEYVIWLAIAVALAWLWMRQHVRHG